MDKKALLKFSGLGLLAIGFLAGCHSGSTDGGDVDHTGTQYDPAGSGAMRLDLVEDELTVGEIGGFRVYATDAKGAPVTQMRITCDTENGLALIEPTSGVETTDSNGQISGRVGCNVEGSYLIACRLQGVSARRQSATVRCSGDRPAGFTGFTGAGGGGLGGGSVDPDTISTIRVTAVAVSDGGTTEASTTSIDILQGTCTTGTETTPEPFYDSSVKLTVTNNSPFIVRFTGLRYRVSNGTDSGGTFTSSAIAVNGEAATGVDANGGKGTVDSLFLDASGNGKRYIGSSTNIPTPGIRNVTFILTGTTEIGEEFEVTGSTALSFDNFNRCS